MTILDIHLDQPLLTREEEAALARRIEAGVYAGHLLEERGRTGEALAQVRDDGRVAWRRLWTAHLRLVMRIAMDFARRHGLPVDDLFQDGCVGLANAMQRYDFLRGLRFTTLAHDYVQHSVAASAARRGGMLEGPLHRQRIRQQIRRTEAEDGEVGTRRLADLVGVTKGSIIAARVTTASIEDIPSAQTVVVDEYEQIEGVGTDFLNLLGQEAAEYLRLRFGIGRRAHSLRELAGALGVSESTARRLETSALAMARSVLSQDEERCVLPAEFVMDPTMRAMGSRLLGLRGREQVA